ncbi:DUF3667 domain-containing protein [Salinimicrobium catena]|uniref:DUF3667 domain-containing protein n=1 Tax=Salinimicrobium catena TaxID=390640 RepID=UPI002FE46ED2
MNTENEPSTILFPKINKERHKLKYRSTECLNCYHPLDISDQYCPNCGQLNSTKKLAFDDFFNEFFAGIFAYDSRLHRTLGALLFKPGKISKDYIEGKRVRYANPYRFYLSASIIFFLVWSIPQDFENIESNGTLNPNREQVAELDSALTAERATNPTLDSLLGDRITITPDTTTKEKEVVYFPESEVDTMSFFKRTGKKLEVFSNYYERTEEKDIDEALDSLNYTNTRFNHWLFKKTIDTHAFIKEPGVFISYFVSKLPFIIFFYLPVFALFIWLLYLRRPFTYMEHLVFTFHNQTTWFVLFGLAVILDYIFNTDWVIAITVFVFVFYLYKAFRRFYGQGRVKTVLKFIIINIIFFTLAVIALAFSFIASFAFY